jgi:hypothetical protein
MIRGKHSCPKFRLGWSGPYELVRRLSDWNYLLRVSRNKDLVVNVNKMNKCWANTASPPHGFRDIPARDQEGDKIQDVTNDEEVTSLVSQERRVFLSRQHPP